MTAEEWIAEAKEYIEGNNSVIEETNNMSSRDSYWPRAKHDAERAVHMNKFLVAGIKLLKEKHEN